MSRVLMFLIITSALATGTAIVLGLTVGTLASHGFWADLSRSIAVASWVITALAWCTERICSAISDLQAAIREQISDLQSVAHEEVLSLKKSATKREKRTAKRLRRLEVLTQERIEVGNNVLNLFERRASNR